MKIDYSKGTWWLELLLALLASYLEYKKETQVKP